MRVGLEFPTIILVGFFSHQYNIYYQTLYIIATVYCKDKIASKFDPSYTVFCITPQDCTRCVGNYMTSDRFQWESHLYTVCRSFFHVCVCMHMF